VDSGVRFTGSVVHWDGTSWSPVTSLSAADLAHGFGSVWSSGPNDVWIGGDLAVHHWNGVSWSVPVSGQDNESYLVGGSGPNDVWAVTSANDNKSVAAHWNGVSWQRFTVSTLVTIRSVVAISPINAWLLADEGVAHWDGAAWTLSDAGTDLFSTNLWWDGKTLWTSAMRGIIRHP
jgi:hypothetical protein